MQEEFGLVTLCKSEVTTKNPNNGRVFKVNLRIFQIIVSQDYTKSKP